MSPKNTVRPTKKQRELLTFIDQFIGEHGYSPSYREIMSGLNYTSVATVALHVNSLIKRGHLRKRDRSARSLEVVDSFGSEIESQTSSEHQSLVKHLEGLFQNAEAEGSKLVEKELNDIYVLVGALKVMGAPEANIFIPRLQELKVRATDGPGSID